MIAPAHRAEDFVVSCRLRLARWSSPRPSRQRAARSRLASRPRCSPTVRSTCSSASFIRSRVRMRTPAGGATTNGAEMGRISRSERGTALPNASRACDRLEHMFDRINCFEPSQFPACTPADRQRCGMPRRWGRAVSACCLAGKLRSPAGPAWSTVVGAVGPTLVSTRASGVPLTGWAADHRWSCPSGEWSGPSAFLADLRSAPPAAAISACSCNGPVRAARPGGLIPGWLTWRPTSPTTRPGAAAIPGSVAGRCVESPERG